MWNVSIISSVKFPQSSSFSPEPVDMDSPYSCTLAVLTLGNRLTSLSSRCLVYKIAEAPFIWLGAEKMHPDYSKHSATFPVLS